MFPWFGYWENEENDYSKTRHANITSSAALTSMCQLFNSEEHPLGQKIQKEAVSLLKAYCSILGVDIWHILYAFSKHAYEFSAIRASKFAIFLLSLFFVHKQMQPVSNCHND